MTAALEGGEWSAVHPGRTLPLGKTRYPCYRRFGGPQGRSGRAENVVPTGIRSWTVQHIVSRYTDWATGPTNSKQYPVQFQNKISIRVKINYWYLSAHFLCLSGRTNCTQGDEMDWPKCVRTLVSTALIAFYITVLRWFYCNKLQR